MPRFGLRDTAEQLAHDFSLLFQVAPIGLALLDRDLRYVRCNEQLAEINGVPAEAHIGRTVAEIVPGVAPEAEAAFREALASGVPRHGLKLTGTTPKAPEFVRTWVENITPLADADGVCRHILVSVQEVTALEEAKEALRENERIIHASQQLSPDGLTILKAVRDRRGHLVDFVWEYANPAAQRMLHNGLLVGRRLLQVLPGNAGHPLLFPRYARLLKERGADDVELEYHEDGIDGWYRNAAAALDADRIAIAFQDITERKAAEQKLRLTTQEFRHRVKNVLAVVSGLISQSRRTSADLQAFADELLDRIGSLSAVQDLLSVRDEAPVELAAVVEAALRPFENAALDLGRSPEVAVQGASVVPLALALNELATNAIKYGALSGESGRVEIGWSVEGDEVTLSWREWGGPPAPPPGTRRGFGSSLIDAAGRWLPHGRAHAEFAPDGLRVEIAFYRG